MNPFNQVRYRGEHELGRAYMDVRRALDNIEDIKLVADNIKNLRSGNIELSSEGSVLKWKYVNSTEWFDLVDLKVITEDLEEAVDTINDTIRNLNNTVSNHGSQLSALTSRVQAVEEFESRIATLESSVESLVLRVAALENAGASK